MYGGYANGSNISNSTCVSGSNISNSTCVIRLMKKIDLFRINF